MSTTLFERPRSPQPARKPEPPEANQLLPAANNSSGGGSFIPAGDAMAALMARIAPTAR